MIVDEQTGRIMDGRRILMDYTKPSKLKKMWKIEAATQTFATVTLQNYFRMYNKLGMTGTAVTEAGELWTIYKLDVVEYRLTDQWQDKTKRILFIKQLVKNSMLLLKM
jgi:preprotein translocase subunit SecA